MSPRIVPLYDPASSPASWNERMSPKEYAVHFSHRRGANASTCMVFPSLREAETCAAAEIAADPTLCCRIYDHHGFIGAPLRELRGTQFRSFDFSPRYRRTLGASLLSLGLILFFTDFFADFRFGWPGFIGARLLVFGLLVVAIDILMSLSARRQNTGS